jgi:argininosuccinate lyase
MVVWCQVHDCDLDEVGDGDLAKISEHLTPDVRSVLSVPGALAARKAYGGTAPERVAEQVTALRAAVEEHAAWAALD